MTNPAAAEVLAMLRRAKPRPTCEAPRDTRGIYGLYDHAGEFRYIGSASSDDESLYSCVHQQHGTSSERASHIFSRTYNTGRMWRLLDEPSSNVDGDVAERLRYDFISLHCQAVWVPLPNHVDISGLEAQVIALASCDMTEWNTRRVAPYDEPEELVDALVDSLGLSPFERAALGRQKHRFLTSATLADSPSMKQSAPHRTVPLLPEGPFRFYTLDLETANHDRASICQIGVACVRPDDNIETWVTLVNPQTRRWVFSGLHGITSSMVESAPSIEEVLQVLDQALKGRTVYQHSGFDRSAIRAACAELNRVEPDWNWQNSVSVARRAWPELKGNGGHGLASLKRHLGLHFEHHDAGEDARAAAQVVLRAEQVVSGADSRVRRRR